MSIRRLEIAFQKFRKNHPDKLDALKSIGNQIFVVQNEMRSILNEITPIVCSTCESSCCKIMPVEGWFTENDYFVFRIFYNAPLGLRVSENKGTECAFLGQKGCTLPNGIRPFPCVQVNCKAINRALLSDGYLETFNNLKSKLDMLQKQLWPLLK